MTAARAAKILREHSQWLNCEVVDYDCTASAHDVISAIDYAVAHLSIKGAFTGYAYPDEIAEKRIGIIYRHAGERGTVPVRITPLSKRRDGGGK